MRDNVKELATIADKAITDSDRKQLIGRLRELIEALDLRVPHLEREGEVRIAGDAAVLRTKALERIAQLEAARSLPCL